MKLEILFLLLGVAVVCSQHVFTECVPGWVGHEDTCYKFNSYPRLKLDDASRHCQRDGATLVSINSIQEHAFVISWLERYDSNRDTWLTSGVVTKEPEGVQWLGDGSFSNSLNFWLQPAEGITVEGKDSDIVIYNFSSTVYGWAIGYPNRNSSFICEIKLQEIYKIVEEKRDFDYGLALDNPSLAPRGPQFVAEPVDTTILSRTTNVFLDCLASGNPKPSYQWYRGDDKNRNMVLLSTGAGSENNRYSMIGGRLSIENPHDVDDGTYQCRVTNEFGTIMSRPAKLSFGSLGDFSNVPTSNVHGQVSNGAVVECPTISAKPGKVYQWHKQPSLNSKEVIFIRPEIQTHTFKSNGGKLYFSELAPSDAGFYFCTVSLSSMGTTGVYAGSSQGQYRVSKGFELTVGRGVSSNYRPVIQDDFIKAYPGNPKRGQTIQLECFAYGTSPLRYQWFRYNGPIPSKATFTSTRRVMTIPNVQLEDGGHYGCRVDSIKTSTHDHKNYTLDIQAEPYFSYPLTNQHVDVGSRLSWHCEARGKPLPIYAWYKDGKRMHNSTGVTIIGNTMVIDQVQKEHNGMYQCAADNIYGLTFSSAQIRVLEFKPSFRKHPVDTSLSAAVGGNITIVCDPEAAPAPTFEWLFNGNSLGLVQGGAPSNKFKMLLNGNLFIENVDNSHQGEYTCKVTNSLGEDSSSGYLRVFPSIVISQPPFNVNERVNESASILCRASAPPNVDVVYVWLFNDHIINFEEQIEYRLGTDANTGSLYVVGLQYKHEGIYTCRVTTGMDAVEASAYLKVLGPPGEPGGVYQGDNIGQDSDAVGPNDKFVRLYWTDGLTHEGPIIAYTVQFRTNYSMVWRDHPQATQILAQYVQSAENPTKRTVFLTELKPGALHQFRVRAINEFGVGAPSLPTSYITVSGEAPIKAPSGITGGGGKVGDLVIRWDPLPPEDHNGPNLKYIVYWRKKPTTQIDDSRWEEEEVKPEDVCGELLDIRQGRITVCSYTDLVGPDNFYMPYETRIRAKNMYGDGVLSDIYTIMSAEEMPRGTPREVYAVSFNATALDVFWTPVPNTRDQLRGKLMGYRINYWDRDLETEDQARFNIISLPDRADNIDHGLIIGLVPGHWYKVTVQALTSAGYGPKSEYYPQETANFAPALYPTEVHVFSVEGIGVRVNFRGISTNVAEEPLMGYKVQYWPSGENIRKARTLDVGRNNYGTITNLTESILYQMRVYGYSRGGQGERSSPAIYFTVGDGEVPSNPETTEVMAGGSLLQSSLLTLLLPLLLSVILSSAPFAGHVSLS
ncbi:contactin-like [Babylonia areolata]|uniref:contactin-like n=1 Tax=Babylonia areolata TaxID=304850 RepID=UPI003FD33FC5